MKKTVFSFESKNEKLAPGGRPPVSRPRYLRETVLQRHLRRRAEDREYHRRLYLLDPRYAAMSRLRSARSTARRTLARLAARGAPAADLLRYENRIADLTRQLDELRISPRGGRLREKSRAG